MQTDELRSELRALASELEPFEPDVRRVRGRVQRRRIAAAGALLVLLAVPVGIVATRDAGGERVTVAESPKSVALGELTRADAMLVAPSRTDLRVVRATLEGSADVVRYSSSERCAETENSLGIYVALVELNAGVTPQELAAQLPASVTVEPWNDAGSPADWPAGAGAEIFMKVEAVAPEIDTVRQALANDASVATFDYLDKQATYEEFKEIFADEPGLIESTSADALPTSFRVVLVDGTDLDTFSSRYASLPGVDEVLTPRDSFECG